MTSEVSDERLAEILAGLEGVTPGPWETQGVEWEGDERGSNFIVGSQLQGLVAAAHAWPTEIDSGDFERVEHNGNHIASCDPDTIRAILTELQRRRAEARQEPGEDWTCPICDGGPGNNCACSCVPPYRPSPRPAAVTEDGMNLLRKVASNYDKAASECADTTDAIVFGERAIGVRDAIAALKAALAARPAETVVSDLDWSTFDGPTRNAPWAPDPQELIYTAINFLEHNGDEDEDAAEQIIERLLATLRSAILSTPQPAGATCNERLQVAGFSETAWEKMREQIGALREGHRRKMNDAGGRAEMAAAAGDMAEVSINSTESERHREAFVALNVAIGIIDTTDPVLAYNTTTATSIDEVKG